MKILHINTVDQEGGAAKIALKLFLSNNDHLDSSYLVKIKKGNNKQIREIKNSGTIKKISDFFKDLIGRDLNLFLRQNLIKLFANDIQILKANDTFESIEYKKADIVHLHNIHGNFFKLADLIKISSEKKVVWTLHDMWAITGHCANSFDCQKWITGCGRCPHLDTYQKLSWDNSHYLWKLKRKIYNRCFINIVVPSLWLKDIVKKSILGKQNIHYIPNGVDINKFKPVVNKEKLKQTLCIPLGGKILLFAAYNGRNNIWKGWPVIEEFIKSTKKNNYLIVCLGGSGNDNNINTKNLIHIPKILDESIMAKYYAASDLLLFPSMAENLPLTILESMSCKTPVIAFNVGGIKEIIKDGSNGFLVNPGKNKEFIKKIDNWFLLKESVKKTLQNNARMTVINKYNLKSMINSYYKLYETI